jgi:hypothetical protein
MMRSQSISVSSTQRPHSLESETVNEKQKKPDKESPHTLSWNDVSGCDSPNCQSIVHTNINFVKCKFCFNLIY